MPNVVIGGVGYRWQRDASFGLVASDALAQLAWPPGVEVLDLGYGAIYAAQDLRDANPPWDRVILLAATERGRRPGRLYRSRWRGARADDEEIQARIREAGAGVVDLDHLLVIAQHFEALPEEVSLYEVEPVDTEGGEGLSPEVAALLPGVVEEVRREAVSSPGARPPVEAAARAGRS